MIDYHEKAVEDFSAVIKRNPKNAHAHVRRAFSYKALKVSTVVFDICSGLRRLQTISSKRKK